MLTYAQVKLADNQVVIETFLRDQWAETGDRDLPCEPNWEMYRTLERSGSLLLLMAYDAGVPIGYIAACVHPHINSVSQLVATIPTYYVEMRPWRALVMRRLFDRMIRLLRQQRVVHINTETEWQHSAERLLAKLGFYPVKIGYKLRLSQEFSPCLTSESSRA